MHPPGQSLHGKHTNAISSHQVTILALIQGWRLLLRGLRRRRHLLRGRLPLRTPRWRWSLLWRLHRAVWRRPLRRHHRRWQVKRTRGACWRRQGHGWEVLKRRSLKHGRRGRWWGQVHLHRESGEARQESRVGDGVERDGEGIDLLIGGCCLRLCGRWGHHGGRWGH
jgi:hypothetical protein